MCERPSAREGEGAGEDARARANGLVVWVDIPNESKEKNVFVTWWVTIMIWGGYN